MRALRFLPAAAEELLHEVEYYSAARQGTGVRFQAAIESALDRALRHPLGGASSASSTRTALVKGFPFSIVYRANDEELLVVGVSPHRKRPGYWLARLGDG